MKKFKIVGSYSLTKPTNTENDNSYCAMVPLLSSDKSFRYGLRHVMEKLQANGIIPTEIGIDFLCLAALVYMADIKISRDVHSQDSWTREITISLPVFEVDKWMESAGIIKRMLNFLTGDLWELEFLQRTIELSPLPNPLLAPIELEAVTLFSGGMDSLIAAINFLETGSKVAFVSHASDSYTKNCQTKLLSHFKKQYPQNIPAYFDLWTSFDDILVEAGGGETSTRSRSFLFIAFGVCVLSGLPQAKTLYVPENALIALNVPLDALRIGSHSTRTTHPFYLELWNQLLAMMETGVSVVNPYWDKTKGEMANECLNKNLLSTIIGDSISCSSPQKLRYRSTSPQHCGYCVPCIIRRAAMVKAYGIGKDSTKYYYDKVSTLQKNHDASEGVQLRSFEIAINHITSNPLAAKYLIYKSGPIEGNNDYIDRLSGVYLRGLQEVNEFIQLSVAHETD